MAEKSVRRFVSVAECLSVSELNEMKHVFTVEAKSGLVSPMLHLKYKFSKLLTNAMTDRNDFLHK